MKTVTIVGMGMGKDTVTEEGRKAVEQAEVLLGAPRMLEMCGRADRSSCPDAAVRPAVSVYPEYLPEKVCGIIRREPAERYAVLVSGDVGFYSAAEELLPALREYDVRLIPGISTVSCFFARIGQPWQKAALISCHGREAGLADAVRRNRLTFALTGGNVSELAGKLAQAGFGGLRVHVGENLGSAGERIREMSVSALAGTQTESLSALIVENPDAEARVRFGIPDAEFVRGNVPMTKAEIRAVTLSRMRVEPDSVCWDVGAGTGSVSVEMALAAYEGKVFSADRNEEACGLVRENSRRFHIGNITVLCGSAPEILEGLPSPDVVFVGGSGRKMKEIFQTALSANPKAQIAVNAVTLETVQAALQAFRENGMEPDMVQIAASRGKSVAGLHMMSALDPVFLLSGERHE